MKNERKIENEQPAKQPVEQPYLVESGKLKVENEQPVEQPN